MEAALAIQEPHAISRARERCSIELTLDEKLKIENDCRRGRNLAIRRGAAGAILYGVVVRGVVMCAMIAKDGTLLTIYPKHGKNFCRQRRKR